MARVKQYPAETKERARRWYTQGLGLTDIANRLGIGVTTVKNWTLDLPRQEPWKGRDVLPVEMRSEALRLARNGMGIAEIARRVGASYQAVKGWVGQDAKNAEAERSRLQARERYRIDDPALALALSGTWR